MEALREAVPDTATICPKVRLLDVIEPESGSGIAALNKVNQKHLDFVIVDSKTFRVLAAIELDDSSHGRESRKVRDRFVDQAMNQAVVPLLRFQVTRVFDHSEIWAKLGNCIAGLSVLQPQASSATELGKGPR